MGRVRSDVERLPEPRCVVVTGGAGFVGSHVTQRLLAEGVAVHVVDSLVTGKRWNVPGGALFHHLDVREPRLPALVAELSPDVVIHLAAAADPRRSANDPLADAQANVMGSLAVLEAVRTAPRRARVVFSSTVAIPADRGATPSSPYSIGKLVVEKYMAAYRSKYGIVTCILRFANVYGPRQGGYESAGVVAAFCGRLLAGEPLRIFGDGHQTRDFVHARDVADAIWRAAVRPLPADGLPLSLGSGTSITVLDLAGRLSRQAGVPLSLEFREPHGADVPHSVVDVTRAAAVLGWRARVRLEDGLGETLRWFASNRASVDALPSHTIEGRLAPAARSERGEGGL